MTDVMRPYQQSVIHQVTTLWERGVDRVIVCLPTGGGKTEVAKSLTEPFKKPVAVAHQRALTSQLERRLGIPVFTVQRMRRIQEAGQGWPCGDPDLIIWDEIHHGDSADWQQLFQLVPAGCKMLGLTATPWRFSHGTQQKITTGEDIAIGGKKNNKYGKGLGDLFGAMIVGVTPRQLVKSGYLVPLRVMNVVEAQDAAARVLDKVGPSWDEKRRKYTGRLTAASDIRLDPVDAYLRHGEGRKAMYFGHLVPAAERACERFNALGIKANVVHGKLDPEVCEERLAAFARNEYQVMCNVMQLTEGYDCPDVGCIIIDRGANNLNTYLQICGRGARTAPGKTDCLILDLTGCSTEHGDPQKDQDYWVVTSEGRAVSDLQCEVCGTRLSPMFPQRCMKCDPFRPKLGDPKELLDTGMRVYAQLKDLRDASDWRQLTDDQRDERILAELAPFHAETEAEAAVCAQEQASAQKRIQDRRDAEAAAERAREAEKARAELAAREAEMAAKLAAERQERAAKYEAERAERQAAFAEQQREFAAKAAERQRSKDNALRSEFTPEEFSHLTTRLATALSRNIRAGWSLGTAIRDVRNGIERFKDFYSQSSFDVPPAMKPLLEHVQKNWQGGTSPAEYELRRMMQDARTSRYGESWCRKKVKELFGVDGKSQVTSNPPSLASVNNDAAWDPFA